MRLRHTWAALAAVLLAGCEVATTPGSPYALHSGIASREARRPAVPHRDDSPAAAVPVQWSFSTAAGECVASASGPPRTPVFTARVDHAMHLSAAPGGGTSRIAFSGPGGSWTMRASKGRDAAATMPLDGAAVARLLTLLAGGRLRLEGGARPTTLLLPNAGVSGRDWMGCASSKARAAGRDVAGR